MCCVSHKIVLSSEQLSIAIVIEDRETGILLTLQHAVSAQVYQEQHRAAEILDNSWNNKIYWVMCVVMYQYLGCSVIISSQI